MSDHLVFHLFNTADEVPMAWGLRQLHIVYLEQSHIVPRTISNQEVHTRIFFDHTALYVYNLTPHAFTPFLYSNIGPLYLSSV